MAEEPAQQRLSNQLCRRPTHMYNTYYIEGELQPHQPISSSQHVSPSAPVLGNPHIVTISVSQAYDDDDDDYDARNSLFIPRDQAC